MRAIASSLTIIALALCLSADTAGAYCLEGALKNPLTGAKLYSVPVFLVYTPGQNFVGLTVDTVEHQLRVAVDDWAEESGSNFRPYYAGKVTSAGAPTMGQVYIRQTTDCSKCGGSDACEKTEVDTMTLRRVGSTIWFEGQPNGGTCDGAWPYWDVKDTVVHELGHAWGIDDEYLGASCSEAGIPQSVMAQNCNNGANLARRDVTSMKELYGQRSGKSYSYVESSNVGLSWTSGSPADPAATAYLRIATRGYIGSLGTSSTEKYAQAMLNDASSYLRAWSGQPGGVKSYMTPFPSGTSESFDVAAAAMKDDSHYMVVARAGETEANCNKDILVSITYNNGTNWQSMHVLDSHGIPIKTWGEGVSAAYDYLRDVYVIAYLDNSNLINSVTIRPQSPYQQGPITAHAGHFATDHPTVACGHATYTGASNCAIAYASRDSANTVRFVRGSVDASQVLVLSPTVISHNVYSWQPPTLAATSNGFYPWVLGLKQGETFFTWRFNPSTSTFVDERQAFSVATNGSFLSAALAQFSIGGVIELHLKYSVL